MKPYFTNLSEFMHMGGHGSFVWVCYGITIAAIVAWVIFVRKERQATIAKLSRQNGQSARLTNKQRTAQAQNLNR
ncbi:heme exporter protein CcmD [Moraxella caviae]|uniref:Heme exporter protein D n=1 Tax=Moraxella caviae TaxID=34060 RepID=A0A1T0A0Z2_9GAMM|nr:heme exporter protein CcmD [Moraxella caviae]OOR89395.1 heme exporter protein CcmD [Moraxella caviae]STZ09884.1 heme exporter protein CcmD [Moraxella caviae]VEW12934.1 heme exporter protein CcmD [Moraxella caviae]